MKINRLIAGVGLVGLFAAGVVRNNPPVSRQVGFGVQRHDVQPSMPAGNVLGTQWFCPGAQINPDGSVTATVVLANPYDTVAIGTLHIVPIDGKPVDQAVTVDPKSRKSINIGALVNAGWVAATVEVSGAPVSAEIVTSSRLGTDASACASQSSASWYFASGQTISNETVKATEVITLYNPYNEDASVDVRYVTDEGPINPLKLRGFVVPAGAVRIINVGETAIRKKSISASLTTRVGRVVAARYQSYDGSVRTGATFGLGAMEPGFDWAFPYGQKVPNGQYSIVVYNPGDSVAAVDLEVTLEGGQAEPTALTVPGRTTMIVDFAPIAQIPNNTVFSVVARSTNSVPIVAERVEDFAAATGAIGTSTMLGSPGAFNRWILTAGGVSATQSETIAVFNPGTIPVDVRLEAFGTVSGPVSKNQPLTVKPGGRIVVKVGDAISGDAIPVVVTASGPVVVERGILAVPTKAADGTVQPGTGTSYQLGIPYP